MNEKQTSGFPERRGLERQGEATPVVLTVDVFAQLIGSASRLLTGVAALAPFKEGKLGLAEWIALSLISQNENMTNRQIATSLGVTAQRVNQLTESLSAAQLISITQASDDSRKKVIRITPLGRNELSALNAKLTPILVEPMKSNPRAVVRTARGIARLTQVVAPRKGKAEKVRAARAGRE